jgi:hypothetical protein
VPSRLQAHCLQSFRLCVEWIRCLNVVDVMSVDKMLVDEMVVDKMLVYKMLVDKMLVDKI